MGLHDRFCALRVLIEYNTACVSTVSAMAAVRVCESWWDMGHMLRMDLDRPAPLRP